MQCGLIFYFDNILVEIQDHLCDFKEVQAQQSLHRTFGRQIVTNDFDVFDFDTKTLERWKSNDGSQYDAVGSCNFDALPRFGRVDSNGEGCLDVNHREGSPRVHSQLGQDRVFPTGNSCPAQDNAMFGIEWKRSHRVGAYLKRSGVTFRKRIFRVLNQNLPSPRQGKKFLVNFVSMGTVHNQSARYRGCGRLIHFVDGYQEPFSVKAAFDGFNFLGFHGVHLRYITTKSGDVKGLYA